MEGHNVLELMENKSFKGMKQYHCRYNGKEMQNIMYFYGKETHFVGIKSVFSQTCLEQEPWKGTKLLSLRQVSV